MGKAANILKAASMLFLIALGINGYKSYSDIQKKKNINELIGNLSVLCNEKARITELEEQYSEFSKNKDKTFECKNEDESKEYKGSQLAFYTNKELKEKIASIGNLEEKLGKLDKKVKEVDLGKNYFEKYFEFKDLGYIFIDSDKKPVFLKITGHPEEDVYLCRPETEEFRGCGDNGIESFVLGVGCDVIIDISKIEDSAEKIGKNWNEYIKNNEYFEKNDSRWKPNLQPIYNLLKDEKDKKTSYIDMKIKDDIIHEKQHLYDRGSRHNNIEAETRAYLKSLMNSPVSMYALENALTKDNDSYRKASEKIINGLMSFNDIKSKRDLYRLSGREISKRAEILFRRFK